MAGSAITGVRPVHDSAIAINVGSVLEGQTALTGGTYTVLKEVSSISVSVDGSPETWNSLDSKGWQRALVTKKAVTASITVKRIYGDTLHDSLLGLTMQTGTGCNGALKLSFPNGQAVYLPCVINVKSMLGSDPTGVEELQIDFVSSGQPYVGTASA